MTEPATATLNDPPATSSSKNDEVSRGFKVFTLIWLGQVASTFGSSLSNFGLGVWVFDTTQSVSMFSLVMFLSTLPGLLIAAPAGALVDRWDRRRTMIWSDLGAGAGTLAIAFIYFFGELQIWHIAVFVTLVTSFGLFQQPAFTASVSLLVPKSQLGRASGMRQAGDAAARVLAPVLAGALLAAIGLGGLLSIDVITFLVAVGALLMVRIPRPPKSAVVSETGGKGSLWSEAAEGWRYIRERPGLFALLLLFTATNLSLGMVVLLLTPMILTFASPTVLGTVVSIGGLGVLLGSVAVAITGGAERRVRIIVGVTILQGILLMVGGVRESAVLLASIAFLFLLFSPVAHAADQVLWQVKTPPAIQGRVFAIRNLLAQISMAVAYLVAGPLADHLFEPALMEGGALAHTIGSIIGLGPGRGMGFMFILIGILMILTTSLAALYRPLRRVEAEIPDALLDEDEAVSIQPS